MVTKAITLVLWIQVLFLKLYVFGVSIVISINATFCICYNRWQILSLHHWVCIQFPLFHRLQISQLVSPRKAWSYTSQQRLRCHLKTLSGSPCQSVSLNSGEMATSRMWSRMSSELIHKCHTGTTIHSTVCYFSVQASACITDSLGCAQDHPSEEGQVPATGGVLFLWAHWCHGRCRSYSSLDFNRRILLKHVFFVDEKLTILMIKFIMYGCAISFARLWHYSIFTVQAFHNLKYY